MATLHLYLVCDDLVMGDNSDMFITAQSVGHAVQAWRKAWEQPGNVWPERVITVPAIARKSHTHQWDTIEQRKYGRAKGAR